MDTTKKNVPPPVERIKANLLEIIRLTRDTIRYVSNKGYKIELDPSLCDVAIKILEGVDSHRIVDGFLQRSYNYWDKIKLKDEPFLLANAEILFGELPNNVIQTFVSMMLAKNDEGKSFVPDETKECVWELIHAMIKGAIKYVHESRCPKEIDGKKQYTVEFFPKIRVSKEIEIWKIKL